MDRREAGRIGDEILSELRAVPYAELIDRLLDEIEVREKIGPSGVEYQAEIQALWDSARGGNLRVFVAVDDGTLRGGFKPQLRSFILSPDGTFIGE